MHPDPTQKAETVLNHLDGLERVQVKSIVQLAPPHRGSALAEQTGKLPFVGAVLGPSFWEVAEPGNEVPPE